MSMSIVMEENKCRKTHPSDVITPQSTFPHIANTLFCVLSSENTGTGIEKTVIIETSMEGRHDNLYVLSTVLICLELIRFLVHRSERVCLCYISNYCGISD